jgi:hypothetical protein
MQRVRGERTRVAWVEELRFPLWLGGRAGVQAAKPVLRRLWRRNLAALAERVAESASSGDAR